jgi:hypothetical protein
VGDDAPRTAVRRRVTGVIDTICPAVGRSKPASRLNSVVLPALLGRSG